VYARAVVAEMLDSAAKTADILGTPSVKLRLLPDGEKEPIQDVVGKLRYLADRTRPDLLAAVNELGSGAAKPGVEHLRAAKRVLRYLKGTVESCLLLRGVDSMIPLAYCDAVAIRLLHTSAQ
jgi:LmbE family N-acetylglucosaminyl deacetylase